MKKDFTDFEEFTSVIRDWDLHFLQLDTGSLEAGVLQFGTASSLLGYARFNRRFDQRGATPKGLWTFGIFSEKSTPIVWHNNEIANSHIVIYKPGAEIDCVSKPGFEVFTLSCSEKFLNRIAGFMALPEIKKLVKDADHIQVSAKDLCAIRKLIREMILETERENVSNKEMVLQSFNEEIFSQILPIFAHSKPKSIVSLSIRSRAIHKIKDFLSTHPYEPVMVSTLCNISGMSERWLQYAFREHYGVSPKTYLKNSRLNGVRRELWKSNPAIRKVNDVASIWGFWHMGQFAADYKKLFGELPSVTLKNRGTV